MKQIPFVSENEKGLYDNGSIAITNERLYYKANVSSTTKKLYFTRVIELKSISSVGYGVVRNYFFIWAAILCLLVGLGGGIAMTIFFLNSWMTTKKLIVFLVSIALTIIVAIIFFILFANKKEAKVTIDYNSSHTKLSLRFMREKDIDLFIKVLFKALDEASKPNQIRPNRLNLPF